MRSIAVVLVLAGCAPPPALLPHERVAGEAARRAWAEKGLPEPTQGRCDVDRYTVFVAKTPAEYNRYCPTSSAYKSAGCLAWTSSAHWFFWKQRPIVVVSPIHYSEPTIVVHELMHAYFTCAGLRSNDWNPGDREHMDARVWSAAGGENAAQTLADKEAARELGKKEGHAESESSETDVGP